MDKELKEIENNLRNTFQGMDKNELIDKLVSLTLEQIKDCNASIERCKTEIAQNSMVLPVNLL